MQTSRRDFLRAGTAALAATGASGVVGWPVAPAHAAGAAPEPEEAGTFDVRITFTGLLALVPLPAEGRLHVLMPSTAHTSKGGMHVERHVARLGYDAAYARRGATGLDGRIAYVPLERSALELVGFRGGIDTTLPDEVPDLMPFVRDRLPRERLGPTPGERVISRVTLDAGSLASYDAGALWQIKGPPARHMANVVRWTVRGVRDDSLRLDLVGLNGGAANGLPPLYPVGGAVELQVLHVVERDLPPAVPDIPEPDYDAPAEHFEAYYSLFDNPAETPIPRYRGWPAPIGAAGDEDARPGGPFDADRSGALAGVAPPAALGIDPYRCTLINLLNVFGFSWG